MPSGTTPIGVSFANLEPSRDTGPHFDEFADLPTAIKVR